MRTFVLLENQHSVQLPEAFRGDDVRFSESLVRHFLSEFTREGDLIFDPFAGYGTTLLVAEEMGRIPYGIELDADRATYVRSMLRHPETLIHGDARRLSDYDLPLFDFSITSPPYMSRNDPEDPLSAYKLAGNGYDAYLDAIAWIYRQLRRRMKPGARVVIEVSNLKGQDGITTLAWDIAGAVSRVLTFEGEIVVGWDNYGYGYDHSYCLVFSNHG